MARGGNVSVIETVRMAVHGVRRLARRSDPFVVAAALTSYAAFGLIPLLAIGTRVSAGLLGRQRVLQAADGVARYVPGPLGLDHDARAFARAAVGTSWWAVVVALLPVSLYAEGIVRSLERFSRARERSPRSLRGRVLTPLLVVFSVVALLLVAGPIRPLFGGLGTGTGPRLLGIFIAFNLLFFATFAAFLGVYRLFATTALRRGPLAAGAFVAASWVSGQLLGYTLALRLVHGFANAFGGYRPAAEVAALSFLVYLENLVFVLGYLIALGLHERKEAPPSAEVRADVDD
ncbi:YhjD/YihY/BrkB family envelope integrity protein [uncultured Jatrophihabitans sp.]|uniref:YhjD/YihY/BrkB family envelope integrity protein n=1 Tax=uncultured Jatrophihabitans sp. TaxID=1610747 RepID=UPI0035CA5AF9